MVKKLNVFFTKPLRDRFEAIKMAKAMTRAMQLPLCVLELRASRMFTEGAGSQGVLLVKYFDGCSVESNGLARARNRATRIEATLSLVAEDDIGVAIRFFGRGKGGSFAELATSFNLANGMPGGVGWSEVGGARKKVAAS